MEAGAPGSIVAEEQSKEEERECRRPSYGFLSFAQPEAEPEDEKAEEARRREEEARLLMPRVKVKGQELTFDQYIASRVARSCEEDECDDCAHIGPLQAAFRPDYEAGYVVVRNLSYAVTIKRRPGIQNPVHLFTRRVQEVRRQVLTDMSFALRPGETTVLLGASKSGKTSLFDILAGRRATGEIKGTLLLNGRAPYEAPRPWHRAVAYVQQGDVHAPYLTVKETLTFAASLQLPEYYTEEDRKERVDVVLQLLGLEHAKDTLLGDDFIRGVSGGEKRRVTIGVDWVKGPKFMLLDEPTTGLDASAALAIGRVLRALSHSLRRVPVLCALLQPGNELFALFDNLLLVSHGQVAYWGPVKEALPYFERLGFRRPETYNDAEFLASVVERPAEFLDDPERGDALRTPEQVLEAWRASELRERMERVLGDPPPDRPLDAPLTFKRLPVSYPASYLRQTRLLLWRGRLKLQRDWQRELLNYSVQVVFALVIAFFFFRLDTTQTGLALRLSVLYYGIARISFNALSTIPNLFAERSVFYRQRAARYYAAAPYGLSNILLAMPLGLLDVVTFASIVYWVVNLYPSAQRFFYFMLMLFFINQTLNVFSLLVSAIMPAIFLASLLASFCAVFMILFSGFLITRTHIPKPWLWGLYISPLHYIFDGLALNEFFGRTFTCTPGQLVPPASDPAALEPFPGGFAGQTACPFTSGVQFLASQALSTTWSHRWLDFIALAGFYLLFATLLLLALQYISFAGFVEPTGAEDVSERVARLRARAERAPIELHPGAALAWDGLNYVVKDRQLLTQVAGYVRPKMLLALMGSSGAGKTTLLDVLARRKNVGRMEGSVLLRGRAPDKYYHRYIGYVEQTDVHWPSQTVLEALEFAAKCRLPETVSAEARAAYISRVLELLDMTSIAGQQVGLVGGLNPDQRKRLTIGVELAADPQVLFLDEPTSGLDAAAADRVMSAVSNVAKAGASVICTIHQPSTRIFALCTDLLLLSPGGKVSYFGPVGEDFHALLAYFERHYNEKCAPGRNPADFALELSRREGNPSPPAIWQESPEHIAFQQELEKAKQERSGVEMKRRYPLPLYQQLGLLLRRFVLGIWRNPVQIIIDLTRALLMGLIFGTVFWMLPNTQAGIREQFGALYFSAVFANLTSFAFLPAIYFQRPLFARERAEGFYRTTAYGVALILSDMPFLLLGATLYTSTFYWLSGLKRTASAFFFYLLAVFALTMLAATFARLVAVWSPRPLTAGIIYSSTFAFFALTAGFLRTPSSMPKYFIWAYWISFLHWFLEPVALNQFSTQVYYCAPGEATEVPILLSNGTTVFQPFCPLTTGAQVIASFGLHPGLRWPDIAVLYGLVFAFVILILVGLRFLQPIKR